MDDTPLIDAARQRALTVAETAARKAVQTLTEHDCCDVGKCGARAYVQVIPTVNAGEILFCGHHGRGVEWLAATALVWLDEREFIDTGRDRTL